MIPNEVGVESSSRIFFPKPLALPKNLFYYPIALGEFDCAESYHVNRLLYPSILVLYIDSGLIGVEFRGKKYIAEKGNIMLLNCYEAHEYYAVGSAHTLWLHFDGAQSIALYESIYRSRGAVLKSEITNVPEKLLGLLDIYENQTAVSAPMISAHIYSLFCNIFDSSSDKDVFCGNERIEMAIQYIHYHMNENIRVQEIADYCAISIAHFSRLFKKQVGASPYEYLSKVRVETAKKLLKTSNASVGDVGEKTGFSDASSFIVAFKNQVGLTPGEFRRSSF